MKTKKVLTIGKILSKPFGDLQIVVSAHVFIEHRINEVISEYFFNKMNGSKLIQDFEDEVLSKLSFKMKIEILKNLDIVSEELYKELDKFNKDRNKRVHKFIQKMNRDEVKTFKKTTKDLDTELSKILNKLRA